jgi:putative Mn2+ efflux pump MntP
MSSLKISDSRTEKGKKIKLLLHLINVCIVTFIYITLVYKVGAALGVDVDKPLREYDKLTVLSGFLLMLLGLSILYGTSFKILSWLFFKFRL